MLFRDSDTAELIEGFVEVRNSKVDEKLEGSAVPVVRADSDNIDEIVGLKVVPDSDDIDELVGLKVVPDSDEIDEIVGLKVVPDPDDIDELVGL